MEFLRIHHNELIYVSPLAIAARIDLFFEIHGTEMIERKCRAFDRNH